MQSLLEILFVLNNRGKISNGKSKILYLRNESRNKLKFGEVSLYVSSNFFERKTSKKIPPKSRFNPICTGGGEQICPPLSYFNTPP